MKRVVLLFALAMFGFVGIGKAQTELPGQCSVFYPEVLAKKAVIELTDASAIAKAPYGQSTKPASPKHWVVYSDRMNNVTYTKPDGSKVQYTKLGFNEQVRIAKIQNGYALVYTEPMAGIEYPKISHEAVSEGSKGWIPMSKLLLWHSCPADKFGIYQKALICANFDEVRDGKFSGKLYRNPEDKSEFVQLSSDMKFYYVMKSEGSMSLLAHTHTLDGRSSTTVLYGWVERDSYVPWNQRSCLEPTWDKEHVEYFVKNGVTIDFYDSKEKNESVAQSGWVLKPEPLKYDKYLYRMSRDQLRYPILDGSTASLWNISTFTKIGSDGSHDISAANEKAAHVRHVENINKSKTNINIGLVIDGTASMGEFYPAVTDAIKKSCSDIFSSQYKVKVGAVIYRDYTDGDHKTDVFNLTSPKNTKFFDWLSSGNGYGITSAKSDLTDEEALYLGINTALDELDFKPEESNILIVVGDCGNDRNDDKFDRDDIVKKIVDKDVQVVGFQVRNKTSHIAFGDFNQQMQYIIVNSNRRKFEKLSSEDEEPYKVEFVQTNDGYELKNSQNSFLYIGSHSRPSSNSVMDFDKLYTLITSSVIKYAASVENQIKTLSTLANVGFANSNLAIDVPQVNKKWAELQVGKETYEELNKSNTLITFSGYADKERAARPLFKPVIFISSDELTELLAMLDPVNDAAALTDTNNREPYVNAMMALAMQLTGENIEEAKSMGLEDIRRKIAGLNEATSSLKGNYTIPQIANPQSVDGNTYARLVADFKRKYEKLRNLKDTKAWQYVIEMNGIKYYWIPMEEMP